MSDAANSVETHGFQTEVSQLLSLMTHSLYSNKEIFLRELISNAADACDKIKFLALSDDKLYEGDTQLKIRVTTNAEAGTIVIEDSGIGMTKEEVIQYLGTIAHSGTKNFLQSVAAGKDSASQLIGQFGVGFYSAFIVADKVTVITRKAGSPQDTAVRWESAGTGEYTIASTKKESRGTQVILHLKESEREFCEAFRVRSILEKYSAHIPFSIEVPSEDKEKPGAFDILNSATALWVRPKNEIKEEEYKEFYKDVAHDYNEPLSWVHARIEGTQEFQLLFYIPSQVPMDMMFGEKFHGVKLYVKRVFIMDDSEKLLPRYLRFVRGVIDANDLPLNVSREILQESRVLAAIRSQAVKKILSLIEELAVKDSEKFTKFWQVFGVYLKEGIVEDFENRERLAKIIRFATTVESKCIVTLPEYVARMKKDQDKIWYLIAESESAAKGSPALEIFRKKEIEVLLLTDRIDHWMVTNLREFDGKELKCVTKGDLDQFVDEKEKEENQKKTNELKPLTEKILSELKEKIKEVRVSSRLTDSPACLVTGEFEIDPNLARLLKQAGQAVPDVKPVLEINPNHFLVRKLNKEEGEKFKNLAWLVHDQAVLADGGQLDDPAAFVRRTNDILLSMSLG